MQDPYSCSEDREGQGHPDHLAAVGVPRPAPHGYLQIVGPDGAGKSALSAEMQRLGRLHGVPVEVCHYRPGVIGPARGDGSPVVEPHAHEARSTGGAVAKLGMVYADTVLGDLPTWRGKRRRGILVVERGWFDMAVDPRRYRLPASLRGWVLALGRTVPRPDLAVVLHGDPTAINARKPEIGVLEVVRQIREWRSLAPRVARRVMEIDAVAVPLVVNAESVWAEFIEATSAVPWRRVPFSARRLDLCVAGRVPPSAWVQRSYRLTPRLMDPLRPTLSRFGARVRTVDSALESVSRLWRQLGIFPTGLLAMRSSAEDRWVVAVAERDELVAVAKIGGFGDTGLRSEAAVVAALAPGTSELGVPQLLWAGEFEGFFAMVTRAVPVNRSTPLSLEEVRRICSSLVLGQPGRPPIVHGDLTPWNVVRRSCGVCVFDWEHARWQQLPMMDLAHYLIQAGSLLEQYTPAQVAGLLVGQGSPGWKHLEDCGIDPSSAPDLVRRYIRDPPYFAARSEGFRARVARCIR